MASSSSSAPSSQSPKKYDVFISFRGEDTRFNFTSHLHNALRRNHINTYIDHRLEKGDEIWPSLEKAIQDSTLFLIIFSENYASSTWTLKELTKILECSKNQAHLVMPVFYTIHPSHVRKQSGSYQKAFEEHQNKIIDKQQLQKWREALTHASNLAGWDCSFDRDEAELIEEIVNCVVQKLGPKYQSDDHLKGFIGIHERMVGVESLLDKSSNDDVQFIGIWGMGGIGKTTLAKALFHKWCFAYEGFCFLANVRVESKKHGIDALREKLILKLLRDKESYIGMLDATYPHAMSRLSRKKVFIVLDDVDDLGQLENLAKKHEFGSGSKILITSRDKQVLGKEVDDIYEVEALDPNEALDLFSMNALRNDSADPEKRKLAKKVTRYADGNPLALKVLGSLLYGKNQEAWESQLNKLKNFPCPKINDILKLSLEGLDKEERKIFLHIACFFNYYDMEDVKNLLDACGYSTKIGLMRLEDKALLDIHQRRICMHHLIEEMGRQIIREESLNNPKKCNILWISKEISEILKKNKGSKATEGIILNISEVEEMCLSSMPNLKFLYSYGNFNGQFGNKLKFLSSIEILPNSLRLLRWVGYPLKSFPATFKGENLVQIQMPYSNLTKLWDGIQSVVNLRKVDLSGSEELIELPNFSKAIHLTEVDLRYCSKLQSVDPSILSLHSLRRLLLNYCKGLTNLTSNTHLKSLSELQLIGCSRLNKFSVTSENCGFHLNLSDTAISDELCSSTGLLSKIDLLELDRCKSVTTLHKLVDLRNLTRLEANGCNKLALNLHSMFDEMRALQYLGLKDCSELFEVPDNINLLSSLHELDLSRSNIETLPLSIKHLLSLQDLHLGGCKKLKSLPELPPSISILDAENCLFLETLHLSHTHYYNVTSANFIFMNCMKLDAQSITATKAKVLLEINKAIHETAYMEYPGERIPKWFMYRTTQSTLTVDLLSIPQPWDGNFIFCVVISESSAWTSIDAKWYIDGQYACTAKGLSDYEPMLSDHVFLWYNRYSCGELQRRIEETKRDAQSNTYHPLLQIQFTVDCHEENGRVGEMKECGVCPTSALEYQNYIKQIHLALHPLPDSIAILEAPSRKRKYHSLLR